MKGSAFLLVVALLPALAFADCIDEAARLHQVNTRLARATAQVESRMYADTVDANSDGNTDIGLMQINSNRLPSLARYGITRTHPSDACVSAYVGNWILSRNIQQFGLMWDAVGAYNAKSPAKRPAYARKVYQVLATASSTPSRTIANPVASVRPMGTPRAAARRLQTNTSSDVTIVSREPPNE